MLIKKIKVYLVIIFISLIFSLYLSEAYLTFIKKGGKNYLNDISSKIKIFKKLTGKRYDIRTPYEAFKEMAVIDKNSSITFSPQNHFNKNILPLSGISNAKTIHCNENGYYSEYLSDRHGFNNPDVEWDSEEIEYLIVGDSFAHGACVNRPHDFSSVLRTLSKKSAINLGIQGNGPLTEYASLREYAPKNVKNIIWFYYEENDLRDLSFEIENKILVKYLKDKNFSQNLIEKQNFIDETLKSDLTKQIATVKKNDEYWKKFYSKKKIFLRFIRLDKIKNIFTSKGEKKDISLSDQNLEQFKKILTLTKELSIENNSNLYFVYLGSYYRYKNILFKPDKLFKYSSIAKIVNDLDIPFIDTNEAFFLKEKNPISYYPFGKYGHYTTEGYNKLSSIIYHFIKKK